MMSQEVFSSRCWGCLRAKEDPHEKYVCPKYPQHWDDYEKQQSNYF